MMASPDPLGKTKVEQQGAQIREANVRIRASPEDGLQQALVLSHSLPPSTA